MKITDIEAIVVKQPDISLIGDGSQDTVVIKVHTDEGITGLGEVDSSPYVVKSIIDSSASHMVCMGLKEVVVGEDPFDVEKIWYKMYEKSYYYGRRSVGIHAMSGIDMAIWDIMGKAVGKPVHKLLGGSYRTKLPAYCSILMPDTEDEIKRIVDTYMPKGFRGIKFGWGALGQSKEKDIRLVKAARKALGPEPYLMIDIGMVWRDAKTAIEMCNILKEFDVYWIEEPLSPDNLEGYKRLCNAVDVRISAGEEVGTLYEFKELIDGCNIDVIQPDVSRCGGLTIAKKVVDMAVMKGIPVIPHAFKTGILMSASLHLLAAMPHADFLEYCSQETVLSKNLMKNHFPVDSDGFVSIPDKPGLGIEIDEDVLKKYAVKW
jgi:L-rhamnonate dehydratase